MVRIKNALRIGSFLSILLPTLVLADNGIPGRWSLQDPRNAQTVIDAAMDETESSMNLIIWLFNQSFVENEANVCKSWRLVLQKETFYWRCDENKVHKMPTSANQLEEKENGEMVEKTFKFSANHISVMEKVDHVRRTHIWQKVSDNQLEYTYMMESANLRQPLKWTLVYKKQ